MDIEVLKDKLGDDLFGQLKTHIDDLTGQRDSARNESISKRKGLQTSLAAAEAALATEKTALAKALERLGVESADEIDNLPAAQQGQAEAVQQMEVKLRRAQSQIDAEKKRADEADGNAKSAQQKLSDLLQRAAISAALNEHDLTPDSREALEALFGARALHEGDEILLKNPDGTIVGVKEGVAGYVKTRPGLLKQAGAPGAGAQKPNARGGGDKGKGDFGGDRSARAAAIAEKFPELQNS